MKIPAKKRYPLVLKARRIVDEVFAQDENEKEAMRLGGCLYHAATLFLLLRKAGYKTVLQAGTLNWPRMNKEEDDGECSTHFSYEWQGIDGESLYAMTIAKILPEMHCWIAHRQPNTIIDISTGSLPDRCRRMNMAWTSPTPPNFVWMTEREMVRLEKTKFPLGIRYIPDHSATELAYHLLKGFEDRIFAKIGR